MCRQEYPQEYRAPWQYCYFTITTRNRYGALLESTRSFTQRTYIMNGRTVNEMIPNELLVKILSYLDGASLSAATLVCKHWKHLCECECLWRSKSMQIDDSDALKYVLTTRSEGHSWKESYQLNYGNNLIRSKWKRGKYSDPKHVLELPEKVLCPMSADTWGEIFQMELER